jgi:gas vesicle protein
MPEHITEKKETAGSGEMDIGAQEGFIALAVAVIGLLTALVEKTRRENNRDHAFVRERLTDIKDYVTEMRTDIKDDVKDVKSDLKELRSDLNDHLTNHPKTESKHRYGQK